ncbi:hypothetical protein Pla108_04900 [Botrimarina colliarenosi]|uniref:Uncharacterized protein n=1 Tax=Botrimarina colliarenosi TaxID=2528001 RepID=A0A5C6AJA2_9BACT|nr:hypothetical protein Pla108_04900 [Botrimarina colliarenosi]
MGTIGAIAWIVAFAYGFSNRDLSARASIWANRLMPVGLAGIMTYSAWIKACHGETAMTVIHGLIACSLWTQVIFFWSKWNPTVTELGNNA